MPSPQRSNFIFPGISVEKLKSLWDEIFKHSSRWDLAILANFEQGNSGYECWLKHLKGCKIKYVELPERISPYIQLSEGWEAVKAALERG